MAKAATLSQASKTAGATGVIGRKLNGPSALWGWPAQMALPLSGFLVTVPITGGYTFGRNCLVV